MNWRDYPIAEVQKVLDPAIGSIAHVNEHEAHLMRLIPYTDEERADVRRLFEEERALLRDYVFGDEPINLSGERYRIADERVQITRRARKRLPKRARKRLGHGT